MELIFDDYKSPMKPKRKIMKTATIKHSGGDIGMLKKQMMKLLKKHNIDGAEEHIEKLEGSGFFDTLVAVGKKAIDVGKKAYDVYKKNEGTINKAVEIGVKGVAGYKQGGAKGAVKAMLGGKLTREQYQNKLNEIKKKHNFTHKQAMIYYKQHYGKK
jgi:hypothetical protein